MQQRGRKRAESCCGVQQGNASAGQQQELERSAAAETRRTRIHKQVAGQVLGAVALRVAARAVDAASKVPGEGGQRDAGDYGGRTDRGMQATVCSCLQGNLQAHAGGPAAQPLTGNNACSAQQRSRAAGTGHNKNSSSNFGAPSGPDSPVPSPILPWYMSPKAME